MNNTNMNTDNTTVDLTTDISIRSIAELQQRLREALERGLPVVLAGDAAERTDAAGLQLLTAFVLTAKRQSIPCAWSGASDVLRSSALLLGLQTVLGLDATSA